METIRWGMIGCGDVAEVKSGPALQKAEGSALVAVMRRERAKAEDYARRHNVLRVHGEADALIHDPNVDAVYIATPPSSHCGLALKVAAAGKPCLVEKPMAMNHAECLRMVEAFRAAQTPLWVAYYRRALPRFLRVRELLRANAIGQLTSVHVKVTDPLVTGDAAKAWRFNTEISGAGLFLDLASHYFDIIDFLAGPITGAAGFAMNTGGSYAAEDVTATAFQIGDKVVGTGVWNFNAPVSADSIVFTGSGGEIATAVRADEDVIVTREAPVQSVSLPQSSARAPAADSDNRRRAAWEREVRVDRRSGTIGVGNRSGVWRITMADLSRREFARPCAAAAAAPFAGVTGIVRGSNHGARGDRSHQEAHRRRVEARLSRWREGRHPSTTANRNRDDLDDDHGGASASRKSGRESRRSPPTRRSTREPTCRLRPFQIRSLPPRASSSRGIISSSSA